MKSSTIKIIAVPIIVIAVLFTAYYYINLPGYTAPYVRAAVVLVLGYFVIKWIKEAIGFGFPSKNRRVMLDVVNYLVSIVGYLIVLVVMLYVLHVNLTGILLAGGFAGIVVGLAAQTVLSNIFAGVAIAASDMVKIDEEISVQTWQWGFAFPFYKPKNFSKERIPVGFNGRVVALKPMYVEISTEEGTIVKLPNSEFMGAAITSYTRNLNFVDKLRVEIPVGTNMAEFSRRLIDRLTASKNLQKPRVNLEEVGTDGYLLVVSWACKNSAPAKDAARDEVIMAVGELLKSAKTKHK